MCTVSMIYDYGRMRIPDNTWTVPTWAQFNQLVKQGEEFDKATGQPDCEDPAKAKWAKRIEERLAKLEGEPVAVEAGQPDWEIG